MLRVGLTGGLGSGKTTVAGERVGELADVDAESSRRMENWIARRSRRSPSAEAALRRELKS